MTMIGPTGCGKTTLATQVIGCRRYVVAFGVKARDDTMDILIDAGYRRIQKWNGGVDNYIVLWPEIRTVESGDSQRRIFKEAIDAIFRQGGWTVFFDEVSYLSDFLKMDTALKMLLNQGRSSGITVVAGTQRPAWIPLAFYENATHLFIWRMNDQRNIRRVSEMFGNAGPIIAREIANLERREVLYLNTVDGTRMKTKVRLA
jgi:SpoVK/Ycf46/Vps4 family AAA+-type ATPase